MPPDTTLTVEIRADMEMKKHLLRASVFSFAVFLCGVDRRNQHSSYSAAIIIYFLCIITVKHFRFYKQL